MPLRSWLDQRRFQINLTKVYLRWSCFGRFLSYALRLELITLLSMLSKKAV